MDGTMRRLVLLCLLMLVSVLPVLARQSGGAVAEAIGQANLRATTDVNADLVGEIFAGTSYPVIGRSEFYPWYLLGDPATGQPLGWVFAELVTVRGDVNAVPFSTLIADPDNPPQPPLPAETGQPAAATGTPPLLPSPSPTLNAAVIGLVSGEVNIRYGPGQEYPRVGLVNAGAQLEIIGWHTQLPWVQVRVADAPTGSGWVLVDLLEIQGDLYSLPSTTQTQFTLPTLEPTQSVVQVANLLPGAEPGTANPAFRYIGDQVWSLMLEAGFEIGTSRMGAFYLGDLQTGEAITFGGDIAFSGMSINKIAILARLFGSLDAPPDNTQAVTVVEAMTCSENISTNEMLAMIGGGNPFVGAQEVTTFLQQVGLRETFITAPYNNDPFITPQPVGAPLTEADQSSARPDPFNQVTVDEMGQLLTSIYQCAYDESGPLIDNFDGDYTPRECRQMLHVMSNNRINALFETGIQPDTRIAHKHGWINDTHGDAGVIFTPGGDFVLVTIMHNPDWLDFTESFPIIAESSRLAYNYFNPGAPVAQIGEGAAEAECVILGNPLVEDLMSVTFDE